jgi:hypothetical protein
VGNVNVIILGVLDMGEMAGGISFDNIMLEKNQ